VATGNELRSFREFDAEWITSVVFSPDGRTALSCALRTTFRLWEVATGKDLHIFRGHTDSVWSAKFSPDGRTALSGSLDNTLKLWDLTAL
jgi:WD40 repeat protein